ncbi:IS200/IS605 family transposase [Tenacibaculum finnmarkense]|uniref:IS200/IS605 family transposase n=1 Tax=Tenacibaculum finnmarkense TaxID=2781243 RepID=UPI00187B2A16|nr:IS200/IS605 family transposase [Tenacibaculum finnmarkense]MBE7649022.1 IS200/IS605 family transposase [Tenacibaculum finnmarkense genomovar ulcerans]
MEVRKDRKCVFLMHCHLVFVTKYRKAVFNENLLVYIEEVFKHVCGKFETELVEFNGEQDHVHLLINYPPKIAISKLVNSLKGVSSRRLRQNYPSISSKYYKGVLWSPSYFSGSVGGAPIEILKQYIEQQNRPA